MDPDVPDDVVTFPSAARRVRVGQLRLGMVLGNGQEIIGLHRPDPQTVQAGYGRVYVETAEGGWCYYPDEELTLRPGDDSPLDRTMDEWPGRWWPIETRDA